MKEFITHAKQAQAMQKKMEREGIMGIMNDPKLRKQMEELQKRFGGKASERSWLAHTADNGEAGGSSPPIGAKVRPRGDLFAENKPLRRKPPMDNCRMNHKENTPEKLAEHQKRQELIEKGYKPCQGRGIMPFLAGLEKCGILIPPTTEYCERCKEEQRKEQERSEDGHMSDGLCESSIEFKNGSLHVYPEDLSKIPPPLLERFEVNVVPSHSKKIFPSGGSYSDNLQDQISNLESKLQCAKQSGDKSEIICGQAKPGASLAFLKNMTLFCREFNEKTKERNGELVSVEIVVYPDKTHNHLIKKALGEKKEITQAELEQVAKEIMSSLNTEDIEKAKKIVAGTIRSFNGVKDY
ncbi:12598_t:CDS:2 [Ambispora leptoticha]|uniref:12598_t:CDS:1 n=1 Tax=Ambispora leptoticha TaxID=144679 RepID=A0A9N9G2F0_9GLOM|nr:12598_t:CDS:2 [Ambispora leptoticha]